VQQESGPVGHRIPARRSATAAPRRAGRADPGEVEGDAEQSGRGERRRGDDRDGVADELEDQREAEDPG
jgi:hypothetical protein